MNWVEKYRPQTLSKVVGHPVGELKEWAEMWQSDNKPPNRAIILYGKCGIGKTTSAYALANDMEWEVTELNASDQRTAKLIQKIAGAASKSSSISGYKKLIIIDEADNIHGNADRGGEKAIIELIKNTNQPIILTANNFYDISTGLRNTCKSIRFRNITVGIIVSILKDIMYTENIMCAYGVVEKIADNAKGDLRSAINDLEAVSSDKTKLEISDIITDNRYIQENVFNVLTKIFKGRDIKDAYYSTFNLDENPEDFINWVDENLHLEYTIPEDLARGYDYLSRASLFLGRVRKRQNYGMWKYANVLMSSGIVIAKSRQNDVYTKYQSPTFWKGFGQKKRFRNIRDSTAVKVANKCHVSTRYVKSELFPFLKMLMKDEEYATSISMFFDLNNDEIEFLADYNIEIIQKMCNNVQEIVKNKEYDIGMLERFEGLFLSKRKQKEEKLQKDGKEQKEEKKIDKAQSSLFDF